MSLRALGGGCSRGRGRGRFDRVDRAPQGVEEVLHEIRRRDVGLLASARRGTRCVRGVQFSPVCKRDSPPCRTWRRCPSRPWRGCCARTRQPPAHCERTRQAFRVAARRAQTAAHLDVGGQLFLHAHVDGHQREVQRGRVLLPLNAPAPPVQRTDAVDVRAALTIRSPPADPPRSRCSARGRLT
jgi:hypothetical protein